MKEELELIAAEEIRIAKEFKLIIKIEVIETEQLEIAWQYLKSFKCSNKIEAPRKELVESQ